MIEPNNIYLGDCAKLMEEIPDGFIDLTVTSPPYDNLRSYKGYVFDFEAIAKQLFRVTKDGGVVVWIVGDETKNGSESGTSFRQALYFKEMGFNLHDTMIYAKENPQPLNARRYEQQFEYMFILSKGAPISVNLFTEPALYAGKIIGGTMRNEGLDDDLHRKHGAGRPCKNYRIKRNIWYYPVGCEIDSNGEHPAIFPEKLAQDHILSWSNEGDIVFDPMCGSGTTLKMAIRSRRQFLGFEISPEYFEIARKRIEAEQSQLRLAL